MVFKARGAHTFKLRVTLPDGRSATCSTGTTDKRVARDVDATVRRLKQSPRGRDVLGLVIAKAVTLAAVYDADSRGTLDALIAELRDVDLDPLVSEWATRANAKYVRQVRRFIPAGARFPASRMRRKVVSEFLAGLKCSGPTKNRYRAALSVFAKWLVEREVIDANPVRDVAMQKEHDPRMVWMTWKDAERIAKASCLPYENLFALMATYAVNALKKGYKPTVVAHQLGHKDASMVTKVYGRFIPDAADYQVSATNPATKSEKRREVKRAK